MVEQAEHPGRNIDFPGRHEGEEFQFFFRQHPVRLWAPFWKLVLWTILFAIGVFASARAFGGTDVVAMRHVVIILLSLFFLFTQLSFSIQFYKYFLYVIIVTDKKLHRFKKTMLTVDDHQSIDLWTLEDISKNQHGIIQNLLGFGTLVLVMQTQEALKIHFVPSISSKHEVIMRLREQARSRMMPQQMAQMAVQQAGSQPEAKDL